jgi:hypothetical protein
MTNRGHGGTLWISSPESPRLLAWGAAVDLVEHDCGVCRGRVKRHEDAAACLGRSSLVCPLKRFVIWCAGALKL